MDLIPSGVDEYGHPIGKLESVTIIGVHYKSFEDLYENWSKRKKRMTNNIYICTTDEFISTEDDMERFDHILLPKICFVNDVAKIKYEWQIYLPGFEQSKCCGDSMKYIDLLGRRINEKYFDFIFWINNKKRR